MKETRVIFDSLGERLPEEVFGSLPSPVYVIDEAALKRNGEILAGVAERTGAKILLAQKAFSNYDFYPLLAPYLAGTEASGLYEARLGKEEMPDGEVHVFSAAFRDDEMEELFRYADHIVFNSPSQLKRFGKRAKDAGKSVGIRLNPEYSTQEGHDIYDPCAPGSRLGTTRALWDREMTPELIDLLEGVHFHTLCEQDATDLVPTFQAVKETFGDLLGRMKWINMGGGHHITREDYHLNLLEDVILDAKETYNVEVYLEPGEAVALNAGYFITRVLDLLENSGQHIAILDGSAACHMPDVIEMPYTPPLYGATETEETTPKAAHSYRLAGPTCLSGDNVATYTFDHVLSFGELLCFGDMAIYTTCKNNTFNGMALPNIWKRGLDGSFTRLTDFSYDDFKMRLGTRK